MRKHRYCMLSSIVKGSENQSLIVSLSDVKSHLGVIDSSNDSLLTTYLTSAHDYISRETTVSLYQTTWQEYYDCFPRVIQTMRPNVQSITSLTYYDETNTLQTLVNGTDFNAVLPERQPAVLYPANNEPCWQPVYEWRPDAVSLVYVAGSYAPPVLVHAIKILCAFWFDGNRGSNDLDHPPGLERLLRTVRPPVYF